MATATVEFDAPQGLTLTFKLFAIGADTALTSVSATERTNDKGCYTASVVDVATGTYRASAWSGSTVIVRGVLDHTNATGTETVSISTPVAASDVWAYASRTLTQAAASVTATVAGTDLTIVRGDTLSASFTGLGSLAARTKLWFTVKKETSEADAKAQVQILKTHPADAVNDGLLYIAGAAATTKANGSITVSDETTGNLTIALAAAETAKLETPGYDWSYDIQMLTSSGVTTLTSGTCTVSADSTRATS